MYSQKSIKIEKELTSIDDNKSTKFHANCLKRLGVTNVQHVADGLTTVYHDTRMSCTRA